MSAGLLGGAAAVAAEAIEGAVCELQAGPRGTVARVIDGETLALDDGSEVRLVGALAPRVVDAAREVPAWPAGDAAAEALSKLVLGRPVELAFSDRRDDRYGRLLAHVFIERDGERTWVQGELLRRGHARAYGLPQSSACLAELIEHEAVARRARLGLWSEPAYAERAAYRTRELMRYRSTYQVVTGRVARVATAGGRSYLNFGTDWREDFTVGIAPAALRADPGWAAALQAMEGRVVRVRGWIERRNGPYIEVSDPRQIELLEATDAPSATLARGGQAADGSVPRRSVGERAPHVEPDPTGR
jgi:endonuclease YncB( thermonuclease family)